MNHAPWVNHDIHRIGKLIPKAAPVKKVRATRPYPNQARLQELFVLEDGILKRKKPHHKELASREAGADFRGSRYIRVDDRQCKADRLIRIFKGDE